MHRQISTVIAILALLLTGALVGVGPASASIPDSPVSDSQVDGPDSGGGVLPSDPGYDPGQPSCDEFTMEPCMSGPDGGGGSGGGGFDGLGLPISAEVAAPLIERTRVAALNALLNKPECFKLLSPDDSPEPGTFNPITVINNIPISYVRDNTLDLGRAPGRGFNGSIEIKNGFFLINFNALWRPLGYIETSVYFDVPAIQLPVVQVSVAEMELVVMLHELGHLTGVNVHPNDGVAPVTPAEVAQGFNTQVYVKCVL
jgi:hypothetical protein